MRLFQDAAGTIPAYLPGHPVGLVKRMAGTVDAVQATALSRPTLAQWPKSGRRNLLRYSTGAAGWVANGATPPVVTNGVTHLGQVCGSVMFDQTMPANHSQCRSDLRADIPAPVTTGSVYTGSWFISLSRALTGSERLRFIVTSGGRSVSIIDLTAANSGPYVGAWLRVSNTGADPDASANVFPSVFISTVLTAPVTVYMRQVQLERGAVMTGYQDVVSDYDITEAGVKGIFHLSNDGGDSLSLTLPAGTYGRAAIDAAGLIVVDTVVDPTNGLVVQNQRDAIHRLGAFTPPEEAEIRSNWVPYQP